MAQGRLLGAVEEWILPALLPGFPTAGRRHTSQASRPVLCLPKTLVASEKPKCPYALRCFPLFGGLGLPLLLRVMLLIWLLLLKQAAEGMEGLK